MSAPRPLAAALRRLLRPLVQLMIRNGLAYGTLAEIAKREYLHVAAEEERLAGRKQTISRMAILTGLSRKDVARSLKAPDEPEVETAANYNRAARVVTGWVRDSRFIDTNGDPKPLPFDGEAESFRALVKSFSGDVPPRAILDELERVGAVKRDERGAVCLTARGYLPRSGEAEKLQILGTDVAGLVSTIRHNLDHDGEQLFFQRKVFYNNLTKSSVPQLRKLTSAHAQKLLEMLDRWMAEHDLDNNPELEDEGGCRAGVGIYYFEESETE